MRKSWIAPWRSATASSWQRVHAATTCRGRKPATVPRLASEVMLQQTRSQRCSATTSAFCSVSEVLALASASIDDVFALWSGLGTTAGRATCIAVHRWLPPIRRRFPQTSGELMDLLDRAQHCGGDRRVLLRRAGRDLRWQREARARAAACFEGDLGEARAHRELWDRATDLLPATDVARYTQGLMDLGATVCLARSPNCLLCPAADLCVAARTGMVERYPVKVRRLRRGTREHVWLWLAWRDRLWLTRRPEQGVWAGLWSLPNCPRSRAHASSSEWPGKLEILSSFTHVLTHLDWTLHPHVGRAGSHKSGARRCDDGPMGRRAVVHTRRGAGPGLPAPWRRSCRSDASRAALRRGARQAFGLRRKMSSTLEAEQRVRQRHQFLLAGIGIGRISHQRFATQPASSSRCGGRKGSTP